MQAADGRIIESHCGVQNESQNEQFTVCVSDEEKTISLLASNWLSE